MSPNENQNRSGNDSKRDDTKSRNAEARKNRAAKKSELKEDEPIIKTTTRRPKPTKESPIPSPVPRYNPSIRDAKRPDVPPPPVGYMTDDEDEDDGLDSLFDFDSEDMQQTVADRPSRGKNRGKRNSNRENDRASNDKRDKKGGEKPRDEKSAGDQKARQNNRKDKEEPAKKAPVKAAPVKAAAPVKKAAVEPEPTSDTFNLLAEIKRKIKQELIEELRQELQEELREELKQELGLGKRPRVTPAPKEPAEPKPESDFDSTDSADKNSAEKKTTFRKEKDVLTAQNGKKKAVLNEDREDASNEETFELVDMSQVSQGRYKKYQPLIESSEPVERKKASPKVSISKETPAVSAQDSVLESKSEASDKAKPAPSKKKVKQEQVSPDRESASGKKAVKASGQKTVEPRKAAPEKKAVKKMAVKAQTEKESPAPKEYTDDAEPESAQDWSNNKFSQFNLKPEIMRALNKFDYLEPTPIQMGVIPLAGTGRDVMGQAQTGTGKTAAFSLPILQKLEFDETMFSPRALILVPTRELAVQVRDEILRLGKYTGLAIAAFYGGAPLAKQTALLSEGVDIAVGTPGRIIDLFMRKALDLSKLEFVVLDEADRMLDIGFRPDIEKILRRCPDSRQTMLMSATIPPEVDHLARHYMNNPEKLDFSPKNLAVETIEQSYFSVAPERKVELLKRLLERENPHQAIIFCRTKKRTEQLTAIVKKWYPDVLGMHGDMEQDKRMKTIQKFRDGKVRLLVATDVVGRGLDISGVSHIINYDIPQFCDDYVHRVGRTGRMGKEGVAFTFVTAEEGVELTRIEMRINKLLKRDEIPGFAAFATPAATSSKPDADNSRSEPIAEEPPKPIYGQRTRRVRRAL